jgi:hypothetical protein
MPTSQRPAHLWLAAGLAVLGVLSRLVPHPWNAAPVTAIALFAGTYFSKRWSLVLPLAVVILSDLLIMWHRTAPFSWLAYALAAMLGWWLRARTTPGRVLCASLAGSCLFFLISNFGVWALEHMYPKTPLGLWECYLAGLWFFRHTLIGDLVYTVLLFGAYSAAGRFLLGRPVPIRIPK